MLASFPANMVNHDSPPLENPSNRFCLFGTRSNVTLFIESVHLARKARSPGAVGAEKSEHQASPWAKDAANFSQARSGIAPEINGVDRQRPVQARVLERHRRAVSHTKIDPTVGDPSTVSANRHIQHGFGDVETAYATVD